MSATADITRYRDYFKDLGRGERVEVLAIPSSSQQAIFQRRVLYLEQVGNNSVVYLSPYLAKLQTLDANTCTLFVVHSLLSFQPLNVPKIVCSFTMICKELLDDMNKASTKCCLLSSMGIRQMNMPSQMKMYTLT